MQEPRSILHLDMDAFFASVEELDDPSLRGALLVVGGAQRRGVVAAASYAVRKFGVRSAMSMAEAMRRCPSLIVRPPRRERYEEISGAVFAIFRRFTPLVEALSIDEAFLDVSASRALYGDGCAIAEQIRALVRSELHLTISAGVATSKFVAKVASDVNKPDGLTYVPSGTESTFLAPLPIERMWGVGAKTAPLLRARSLRTLADLQNADDETLRLVLGKGGPEMKQLALGIDPRRVEPWTAPKSVGAEETYDDDLQSADAVIATLLAHSQRVARRMTGEALRGRCITVKVKYDDFKVEARQMTLPDAVGDTSSIFEAAKELAARLPIDRRRVRLTGVSVSQLEIAGASRSLFVDPALARRQKLEATVLKLTNRFGGGAISRGSLIDEPLAHGQRSLTSKTKVNPDNDNDNDT